MKNYAKSVFMFFLSKPGTSIIWDIEHPYRRKYKGILVHLACSHHYNSHSQDMDVLDYQKENSLFYFIS